MQKLEFVYELGSVEPIEIWGKLAFILEKKDDVNALTSYTEKIKWEKIPSEIKASSACAFNIESSDFYFHMATGTNYKLAFLQIKIKKNLEKEWYKEWVDALIQFNGFVHAWVVDYGYNYWQNAVDPVQYKFHNRSYAKLPMKHNGLPDPVGQIEIDTSNNPGLRDIRKGYIEAIGARIWFSEKFLTLINRTIEEIQDAYPCKIEKYNEDVYQLSASVGIFKDSSTEAEQRQLRTALYGSTKQEE